MADDSEGSGGESFMPGSHKKAVAGLLLAAVLIAAGALYLQNYQDSGLNAETPTNDSQEVASDTNQSEDNGIGLSPSEVEGEIVDVRITDIKAEPSSPEISPEDAIRFNNEAGVDVSFSFDREVPDFDLAAGESIIVGPDSIVYYEVTPQDEDAQFRDISARVNVQS